jgi:hypothetical protein
MLLKCQDSSQEMKDLTLHTVARVVFVRDVGRLVIGPPRLSVTNAIDT